MKSALIAENSEIIQEILAFSLHLQAKPHQNVLHQCLAKFSKLSEDWSSFVASSETGLKISKENRAKTLTSISIYKKSAETLKENLKKAKLKSEKFLKKEAKVVTQLAIFPKLWKKNMHKLKQKSLSWRVTPFTLPPYEQELSFFGKSVRVDEEVSEIENVSVEFEKVMKEIEAIRPIEDYENAGISIEKSIGGWKSEFDSECDSNIHNASEIKNAISILYKANLLKPAARSILKKITDIVKKPGNSANLALFLQLVDLNNSSIAEFDNSCENDVKIEELLNATSFLSHCGPEALEQSLLDISQDVYITRFTENHKKTQSLGKNSTKDMTEKLNKN